MKIEIKKPKAFARLLAQVEVAMSTDATRETLNCLHLLMNEAGALYAVATDGHRIHVVTSGNVDELRGQSLRTIPAGWVHMQLPTPQRFRALCRAYSDKTLILHPGTFTRATGTPGPSETETISALDVEVPGRFGPHRDRFVTPVYSGGMISHRQVIPSMFGCWTGTINVAQLKACKAEAISLLGTWVDQGVLAKPFNWQLIEFCDVQEIDGRSLVQLNTRYAKDTVIAAAAISGGSTVRVYGCGSLDPVVFLSGDHDSSGDTFLGVVMPVSH